jgi:S-adenosylmethionine:tRNA ribosyltransferase-isomerase
MGRGGVRRLTGTAGCEYPSIPGASFDLFVRLDQFDYDLPGELIARSPTRERSASRLLHLDGATGALEDLDFRAIEREIAPEDVLVLNDTRVIQARLLGRKSTGGRVEVLVERVLPHGEALAQVRASHAPASGSTLLLEEKVEATVVDRQSGFFRLRFGGVDDVLEVLERHGRVPLPAYLGRAGDERDRTRYQTVYAREPGAVAAPTAGLHFDAALIERLRERGVTVAFLTLHVGAGTFQPVRASDVRKHEMHSERYAIPEATVAAIAATKRRGGRVLAVGTTTLRALESAGASGLEPGDGETRLFVLPGFRFRVVDRLLTNFHLPRSTLLMLVSAFGGMENMRRAYRHAVERRYRFYSYGDAMLIERAER